MLLWSQRSAPAISATETLPGVAKRISAVDSAASVTGEPISAFDVAVRISDFQAKRRKDRPACRAAFSLSDLQPQHGKHHPAMQRRTQQRAGRQSAFRYFHLCAENTVRRCTTELIIRCYIYHLGLLSAASEIYRQARQNGTQHAGLHPAFQTFNFSVAIIAWRCATELSIRCCIAHPGLSSAAKEISSGVAKQNESSVPASSISVFHAQRRKHQPMSP